MEGQVSPLLGATEAYYTLAEGSSAMLVSRCNPLHGWSSLHGGCSGSNWFCLAGAGWGYKAEPVRRPAGACLQCSMEYVWGRHQDL